MSLQDVRSIHLGNASWNQKTVPCCSSCLSQHNDRQIKPFVSESVLFRTRTRGRGTLMNRSALRVVNWFLPKFILFKEWRESKDPSPTTEILFVLRLSCLRRLSPVNIPDLMVDRWFSWRSSSESFFREAKLPDSILEILFSQSQRSFRDFIPLKFVLFMEANRFFSSCSLIHWVRWLKAPSGIEVMELPNR